MSDALAPASTCENCGRDGEPAEFAAVHRVYLDLDEWDQVVQSMVMEEIEQWCVSCRSIYPHESVDQG